MLQDINILCGENQSKRNSNTLQCTLHQVLHFLGWRKNCISAEIYWGLYKSFFIEKSFEFNSYRGNQISQGTLNLHKMSPDKFLKRNNIVHSLRKVQGWLESMCDFANVHFCAKLSKSWAGYNSIELFLLQ